MSNLQYEDALKAYRGQDGLLYVSVTTAIKEGGLMDLRYVDDFTSERGTEIHKFAERLFKNGYAPLSSLPESFRGYGEALLLFREDYKPKPLIVEERLKDSVAGFCGQVDFFGTLFDGSVAVIDWKSGVYQSWHRLQTAAYRALAWQKNPVITKYEIRRLSLYLDKDGKYKARWHDKNHDENVFKSLVSIAHWKRAEGVLL